MSTYNIIKALFLKKWVQGSIGLGIAALVYFLIPGEQYPKAPITGAIVVFIALWWAMEVIPIPVTSLFPLVLFPAFDIADMTTIGANYGRPIIFLFLGGFLLAIGLQKSGVHQRIALHIVNKVGRKPGSLVLGFMISSAFLSMWISNTATVIVLLPIALSVIETIKMKESSSPVLMTFAVALMLGIAYAADIGGMATVIGTPPNMVFIELYTQLFPQAPEIGFLQWMLMMMPMAILFLFIGWFMLTHMIFRLPRTSLFSGKSTIDKMLKQLGHIRWDEKMAASIFGLAALLWLTGSDLRLTDDIQISGWRTLCNLQGVADGAVAIAASSLLFFIPSKDRPGRYLLQWRHATKEVPWGILLLFGAGFAIATAFEISGLSVVVGDWFKSFQFRSPVMLIASISTILTFLTEITSNTAMANLILPILANASIALEMDPRLLLIPATISASCAFMMPVASPTQAIVFGSKYVTIRQMIRAGIWFNILGIILITLCFLFVGTGVLDIELSGLPDWAK